MNNALNKSYILLLYDIILYDDYRALQIRLERVDGLSARIMQLNRPLATLLEEEAHLNQDKFHTPHKLVIDYLHISRC